MERFYVGDQVRHKETKRDFLVVWVFEPKPPHGRLYMLSSIDCFLVSAYDEHEIELTPDRTSAPAAIERVRELCKFIDDDRDGSQDWAGSYMADKFREALDGAS